MAESEERKRVGVIVVPNYFDTTSKELIRIAPFVDVLHTQIRVGSDFGFSLDEIVTTSDEIADCAAALADSGADVVIQLGTPFSTAHGWKLGNDLQDQIEQRIGIPFEMMGLSVPAGALALGLERVAMATTYYEPSWVERYTGFITDAGLEVTHTESFVEQGLFDTPEAAWAASFEGFRPDQLVETIRQTASNCRDVDGIVVPGLPCRFLDQVAQLEAEIGLPIVSYYAIWWKCLSRLGKGAGVGNGALLDLVAQ